MSPTYRTATSMSFNLGICFSNSNLTTWSRKIGLHSGEGLIKLSEFGSELNFISIASSTFWSRSVSWSRSSRVVSFSRCTTRWCERSAGGGDAPRQDVKQYHHRHQALSHQELDPLEHRIICAADYEPFPKVSAYLTGHQLVAPLNRGIQPVQSLSPPSNGPICRG
jgi:hypothetical protein